jgi:hypothetical protein
MCGWVGNGILARAPIRPNSAWKALGVIGPSRSARASQTILNSKSAVASERSNRRVPLLQFCSSRCEAAHCDASAIMKSVSCNLSHGAKFHHQGWNPDRWQDAPDIDFAVHFRQFDDCGWTCAQALATGKPALERCIIFARWCQTGRLAPVPHFTTGSIVSATTTNSIGTVLVSQGRPSARHQRQR